MCLIKDRGVQGSRTNRHCKSGSGDKGDTIDDIRWRKRNRFRLSEEVVEVAVQCQLAESHGRVHFEWNNHGRDQKIIALVHVTFGRTDMSAHALFLAVVLEF